MRWRLIQQGAFGGAWNMAVDEALLESARRSGVPALRFYQWHPACVSLGRLQKVPEIVRESTFDWVRRPTGGRAVFHQYEVTYCAVIPEQSLTQQNRSVLGAYRWLSEGFVTGLKTLGIAAALAPSHRGKKMAENCFSAPAQCDFIVEGRKLIGAAQCRRHGVILQHGAILTHIDQNAWQNAVGGAMDGAVALDELGVIAEPTVIANVLAKGLEECHGVQFVASTLSDLEKKVASKLQDVKYSCSIWNVRGKEPLASNFGERDWIWSE